MGAMLALALITTVLAIIVAYLLFRVSKLAKTLNELMANVVGIKSDIASLRSHDAIILPDDDPPVAPPPARKRKRPRKH